MDRSTLVATDCEVTGNLGRLGGAVFSMRDATTQLVASTLVGNFASQLGGGFYLRDTATIRLERTILRDNCEPTRENDAVLEDAGTRLVFVCSALRPEFLDGPESSLQFDGPQVQEDPMFCDPATCLDAPHEAGDYDIAEASPCTPERSPCGQRIGAGEVSCGITPLVRTSWGSLKSRWMRKR